MITQEKLTRIRAKCVELLAIAEKRTPWFERCLRHVKMRDLMNDEDIKYGLSCAGATEAGWRSTIAAIDGFLEIQGYEETRDGICPYGCDTPSIAKRQIEQILAAWPDEILPHKNPLTPKAEAFSATHD